MRRKSAPRRKSPADSEAGRVPGIGCRRSVRALTRCRCHCTSRTSRAGESSLRSPCRRSRLQNRSSDRSADRRRAAAASAALPLRRRPPRTSRRTNRRRCRPDVHAARKRAPAKALRAHARMAIAIVSRALVRIAQHLVSLAGLFELFFGRVVARIPVRMILQRLLAIRALQLLLAVLRG